MMQFSNDGGFTWSSEYWRQLGKSGEHRRMPYWDRLGMARDRVFKITVSDPVKIVISDAWLDLDEGKN